MTEPVVAQKNGIFADVEEGKTYFWCACGLSKSQPFCDGSHSSTDIRPLMYKATATRKINFCGCKHSKMAPICDGSHNSI